MAQSDTGTVIWYEHVPGRFGGRLVFHGRKEQCGKSFEGIAEVLQVDTENPGLHLPKGSNTLGISAVKEILRQVDEYMLALTSCPDAYTPHQVRQGVGCYRVLPVTSGMYRHFRELTDSSRNGEDWFLYLDDSDGTRIMFRQDRTRGTYSAELQETL